MELVIIWLLFGIAAGIVANTRGRSGCSWFIAGVLLGPFGLLFAFLVSDKKKETAELETRRQAEAEIAASKKCPYCAESIKIDAIVCRYCGRDQPKQEPELPKQEPGLAPTPAQKPPLNQALVAVAALVVLIAAVMTPWLLDKRRAHLAQVAAQAAAQVAAVEAMQRAEMARQEFATNKQQILADLDGLIAASEYDAALKKVAEYSASNDLDLHKRKMLADIGKIPEADIRQRRIAYAQLAALDPSNKQYAMQVARYDKAIRAAEAKGKAKATAPAVSVGTATEWEVVGGQGMVKFVLVKKSKEGSEALYRDAINSICRPAAYCYLAFWSNRSSVPASLPMSDKEVEAQVASYTRNPTSGLDELLLSCRLNGDPSKCF